jgi:hypothetical protein
MEGSACVKLRTLILQSRMGIGPDMFANKLNEAGFAYTGLPRDEYDLTIARFRRLPTANEDRAFFISTDQRREALGTRNVEAARCLRYA